MSDTDAAVRYEHLLGRLLAEREAGTLTEPEDDAFLAELGALWWMLNDDEHARFEAAVAQRRTTT